MNCNGMKLLMIKKCKKKFILKLILITVKLWGFEKSTLAVPVKDYLQKLALESEQVHMANMDLQISKLEKTKKKRAFLPTVDSSFTYVYGDSSFVNSNSYQESAISLRQKILDFKSFRDIAVEDSSVKKSILENYKNRDEVYLRALTSILNYKEAQYVEEISRKNVALLENYMKIAKTRRKAGELKKADVLLAQGKFNESKVSHFQNISILERNTAVVSFFDVEEIKAKDVVIEPLMDKWEELFKNLSENELRIENINKVENEINLKRERAEKARYYPTLNLISRYSINDKFKDTLGRDKEFVVGLSLNFNIFNGLRDSAEIQKKALEKYRNYYKNKVLIKQAKNDLSSLNFTINNLREALKSLKDSQASYRLAVNATKGEHQLGTKSFVDVIEAEMKLTKININIVRVAFKIEKEILQALALRGRIEKSILQ